MNTAAPELTLHELLRNQHVKRWHIVHTDRQQTVAEHLWAVTIMGWALYKSMNFGFSWELWTKLLMLHDSTESITGDLPTPAKKHLIDNGATLGHEFSKEFASLDMWGDSESSGLPNAALKCVDLIEAVRHMDMHGRGAHAKSVRRLLFAALRAHVNRCIEKWPSYNWLKVELLFNASLVGPDDLHDGSLWEWS